MRAENFGHHRGSIPDRPALGESLYRQSHSGPHRYAGHDGFRDDLKYDVLVCVCVRAVCSVCGSFGLFRKRQSL